MGNMGYCRFQNTVIDLQDCYDHIDDEGLSEEEQRAKDRLIHICQNIACDFEYSD